MAQRIFNERAHDLADGRLVGLETPGFVDVIEQADEHEVTGRRGDRLICGLPVDRG